MQQPTRCCRFALAQKSLLSRTLKRIDTSSGRMMSEHHFRRCRTTLSACRRLYSGLPSAAELSSRTKQTSRWTWKSFLSPATVQVEPSSRIYCVPTRGSTKLCYLPDWSKTWPACACARSPPQKNRVHAQNWEEGHVLLKDCHQQRFHSDL